MSGEHPIHQPHSGLIDAAASWLAALDAGTADLRAFEAWREADPRHAAAFAEVASTWRDLDGLRLSRDDLPAGDAQAAHVEARDVDVEAVEAEAVASPERRHFLRAAASVGAVMLAGGGFAYRANARASASTKVGERKSLVAAEGLSLDLNTDTLVYWREGAPARLWLERGEIAIRLAGGGAEFTTPAGRFQLRSGTYNARLREASCELMVVDGALSDTTGRQITAGQVGLATSGRIGLQQRDDSELDRVTAWQSGTLVLTGQSLDYALAEINRYLPSKIVIGDPALSRLRIGGTFATDNPSEFLQALQASFGIRAAVSASGAVVLTRT